MQASGWSGTVLNAAEHLTFLNAILLLSEEGLRKIAPVDV